MWVNMTLTYMMLAFLMFGRRMSDAQKPKLQIIAPDEPRKCGQVDFDKHQSMRDSSQEHNLKFPWMVVISVNIAMERYDYGGSLIHPKVVLTTAQFLYLRAPRELKVIAGRWSSENTITDWPHQVRNVSKILIHKDYSRPDFSNDFALLVLSERIILAENVNTVCLPNPTAVFDRTLCFPNMYVNIVREYFFARFSGTDVKQNIPYPPNLEILTRDACEKSLRATSLGNNYSLPQSLICASNEGVFCDTYGGSPLVCLLPGSTDRYVQVGTFSWIATCNKKGVPGMYGNVPSARLWIDQQMKLLGFDKSSYVDERPRRREDFTSPPLQPHGCGLSHSYETGLVGKWNHSPENQFPWIVAISKNNTMTDYHCAGSLIHPKVVLTAAQCVKGHNFWNLRVSAGRWAIDNATGNWPHQDRDVSGIIIHENYSRFNFSDDFALILVSRPFVLADNVNTVCLPESNHVADESYCYASGFVNIVREYSIAKSHETEFHQEISKPSKLQVLSRLGCETTIHNTALGKSFKLHPSTICANDLVGLAFCNSYLGSPLVRFLPESGSRYMQIGIFSWITTCNKPGVPGMYGNVAAARLWIDRQMEKLELDKSYYVEPPEQEI